MREGGFDITTIVKTLNVSRATINRCTEKVEQFTAGEGARPSGVTRRSWSQPVLGTRLGRRSTKTDVTASWVRTC